MIPYEQPLDSLFLLISVTVCHKNLLNRTYEQILCSGNCFFCIFIYWENLKSLPSSLSLSDMWLQEHGKRSDSCAPV